MSAHIALNGVAVPPRFESTSRWIAAFVFLLTPLAVIFFIWYPVYKLSSAPNVEISDQLLARATIMPPDSVLQELEDSRLLNVEWADKNAVVSAASNILSGHLHLPPYGSCNITFPFRPADLKQSQMSSAMRLQFEGLVVPDTLIQAYEATGRMEYLLGARDDILNWESYEEGFGFPRVSHLDDHAMAARIMVLSKFWKNYRHSSIYQPHAAKHILRMVVRTQILLAKSELFTYSSNHGVMQNLALLHASIAFPALPKALYYQNLALQRLDQQLQFYMDDEGVVLEHSPAYQSFGLELLSMIFRYLHIIQHDVPQDWIKKYNRALKVYASFRRPNGSLPMLGDTDGEDDPKGPPVVTFGSNRFQGLGYLSDWVPPGDSELYPVAGYSIWWTGLKDWPDPLKLSQTVVAWSNFPTHAHKHADELSLIFWAGGQTWWSNVGYWPYGTPQRPAAESWEGSDAPHLVGESTTSSRTAGPLALGSSGKVKVIDVERRGPGLYVARRQVISTQPGLWLVLDSTQGDSGTYTTTTWTTGHNVDFVASSASKSSLSFQAIIPGQQLTGSILGSPGTTLTVLRGSMHPFAGWQVVQARPIPASAVVLKQPASGSWSLLAWTRGAGSILPRRLDRVEMRHWTDAEHWQIDAWLNNSQQVLTRNGTLISVNSDSSSTSSRINLETPADVHTALSSLAAKFYRVRSEYKTVNPALKRRLKLTYLLAGIFVVQILCDFVLSKTANKQGQVFRWTTISCWIVGGIFVCTMFL